MPELITMKKVHKIYHVGENRVHALAGVSISVSPGEFVAITGASGSGKSTMLNMLAGLEPATSGQIVIAGEHIENMSENELVRFRREKVGFIFQSFNLIGSLTAEENVALPLLFRGESRARRLAKARRTLKLVGLEDHAGHKPLQMSGGQQQRVGIARALVVEPRIIFADEPTGNLDSVNGAEVISLLKAIVRITGLTIVMVTHDNELAAQTDRIISLKDGRIIGPKPQKLTFGELK